MRIKYDNKFFTMLGHIIDVLWISILWIVFSIPVFTMGASSTALYYTVHKVVFNNEGYIFSTFLKAFKENFKKSTVKWLISLIVVGFLGADIYVIRFVAAPGGLMSALYYPLIIILAFVIMCQFSIVAYGARFEDDIMKGMGKSIVIAASNLGWVIFLLIMLCMALYICRYLVALLVLLPGGFACLQHHAFEHIFVKMGWISEKNEE